MPEVSLLHVPYISQLGPGADKFRNDCGAACAAMLIAAYTGKVVTPDEVFSSISMTDRYLRASEVVNVLARYGVETQWVAGLDDASAFSELRAHRPLIALVQYAPIRDAGLGASQFGGPHFVVVVGMDIDNVYIHDPLNVKSPVAIPATLWDEAWKEAGQGDNPAFAAIRPRQSTPAKPSPSPAPVPQDTKPRMKVTCSVLNVRCAAGTQNRVVDTLKYNDIVTIIEEANGWAHIGESRWCSLAYLTKC